MFFFYNVYSLFSAKISVDIGKKMQRLFVYELGVDILHFLTLSDGVLNT